MISQKMKLFNEGLKENQQWQTEVLIEVGRVMAWALVLSAIFYCLHYFEIPQKIYSMYLDMKNPNRVKIIKK